MDNSGEFCLENFDRFYKDHGIERQETTTYTPQQNRVAERMNTILMERDRSRLSGASLE